MDDVRKWKENALEILKTYYLNFAGSQWDEFDRSQEDEILLRQKICYAMFGPPTEDAPDIESAYSLEQKKTAETILKVILKVHADSRESKLRVGFIFISCKQEQNEFVLPLFSLLVGTNEKGDDRRQFVDTQCRVYKDWDDWKSNNLLPMLEYAYPKRGFFTCSGNTTYEFSEEKNPDVEFGTSPQSGWSSWIFRQADYVTGFASLGAGVVGVASLFTPLAPVVLTAAAFTGGTSAGYGAIRGVGRLYDKGTHGESLADLESFMMWVGIAATPLHFVSSFVNGTLAVGAQQGRIFSNSMRMFATILNFTTLGVDSAMLAFGFANLINKAVNKQLTGLDILQFSMSAFFFTNTLMQPKVASSIIRNAQQKHFDRHMNSMTDAEAKVAFQKFMDQNRAQGTITDRSKIVRTINRMEDPNAFFKGVGPADVTIGGRKGKTVLVTDSHGDTTRINPNRVHVSQVTGEPGPSNFNQDLNKLARCYGKEKKENLNEVTLNGEKIFEKMNDMQRGRIRHVFGASARKFNPDIVSTAHAVAESMGCRTADELMSVIEILASEVKGKFGNDLTTALSHIGGAGRTEFINGIRSDLAVANRCAQEAGLKFGNSWTAVYHYRKHGAEFPKAILRFGDRIDTYLGPVRNGVFNESNLREVCTLKDGVVRKIYATGGDHFGVVTSTPDGANISTMYHKSGYNQDYIQKLADYLRNAAGPLEPISDVAQRLARFLGFRAIQINVIANGQSTPVGNGTRMDPAVHEHIARLLSAFEDLDQ